MNIESQCKAIQYSILAKFINPIQPGGDESYPPHIKNAITFEKLMVLTLPKVQLALGT